MRIIIGIFVFILGIFLTMQSNWMYQNFGMIATFERFLKTEGGSRLFYKLFGILITVIGILIATNLLGAVLLGILRPLFGGLLGR